MNGGKGKPTHIPFDVRVIPILVPFQDMMPNLVPLCQIFLERDVGLETLDRYSSWSEYTGQKLFVCDLIDRVISSQLFYAIRKG